MFKRIAPLAIASLLIVYLWMYRQPKFIPPFTTATVMHAEGQPGTPTPPALSTQVFFTPGAGGTSVQARFYGMEALPAVPEAEMCARMADLLEEALSRPPAPEFRISPSERSATAREFRSDASIGCNLAHPAVARLRPFLRVVEAITTPTVQDRRLMTATLARLLIDALRQSRTAAEVTAITPLIDSPLVWVRDGIEGLGFRRFAADLQRLRAAYCATDEIRECRTAMLVEVAQSYAVIGRQTDDEQHFHDAGDTLREAESLLRPLSEVPANRHAFEAIASAYGYAGEGGRNPAFLRRAVEISTQVVAALAPARNGAQAGAYSHALSLLASNLGRLAAHETDARGATRRAIAASLAAIEHDARHFPDRPLFSAFINLAASETELYGMERDDRLIDEAVAHARRAVGIVLGRPASFPADTLSDFDLLYARTRLAEALAWRARHRADIGDAERQTLAQEAQTLMDWAAPRFEVANSQTYLRIIQRARPMVETVLTQSQR